MSAKRMPVLFVGHSSPMNTIEDNEFSQGWLAVGKALPKPKAILCISAHWETWGTLVTAPWKNPRQFTILAASHLNSTRRATPPPAAPGWRMR